MYGVKTDFRNDFRGPVAHLVERDYGIVEATGSNPVRSTKFDL